MLTLGRSLRESGYMFWETLWALVLGFTLSGAVQAFVDTDLMRSRLGDHRPRTVVRASWYGMVSSSCSYAASAMAKSLFAGGADFTSAMIFMISSTNLVVELGIVMLVLLGWQFAAAEFVGGPVMIVVLALIGTSAFSAVLVDRARRRVRALSAGHDDGDRETTVDDGVGNGAAPATPTPERSLRRLSGWSNASSYAVADATMLRRELVIGYLVAGFLAVTVPVSWWGDVFLHGHGPWTSVENAFVGPLIAVISWVCSVGNVPLAAALWHGGISFGGVIAFVFADLIAMPLILIYRKFYGGALTLRLISVFYAAMVVAGLVTEVVFRIAGLAPTNRLVHLTGQRFTWDYTTYLNLVFIAVAAVVWSLARRRHRQGEASGYAIDPVCKMQVRLHDAPARAERDGRSYYFCSDRCRERFVADNLEGDEEGDDAPATPTPIALRARGPAPQARPVAEDDVIDPICGMTVTPATAAAERDADGVHYYFCAAGCAQAFDRRMHSS